MRRRIVELANGKVRCRGPVLLFSESKVEMEVLEGQNFEGEFLITSANQVPLKGLVYSSNPRMNCLTRQFEGDQARIRFEFHSEGLSEGDIQKGDFYIICSQGEYNLSFVAVITRPYAKSSIGKIRCLDDFVRLAEENPEEAEKIFSSSAFRRVFTSQQKKERILYEGLSKTPYLKHNLDEFLVAMKRKERNSFQIEKTKDCFYGVCEDRKESVNLKMTGWGDLEITVSSDAGFVEPVKKKITAEDFIGTNYEAEYLIHADRMHGGKNYGRLNFHTMEQDVVLELCVSAREENESRDRNYFKIQEGKAQITKLYMDYRLKKMVTGEWAAKSIEVLKHMQALDGDCRWYELMQAQAFLVNKQRQEALWILEEFKKDQRDAGTPLWGYYLYLCTLSEREPAYVNKLEEKIEEICHDYPEDLVLFWILLFLKEEYCEDNGRRLKAIEDRFYEGAHSPFLYMEAYYLMWLDPYYLVKLEDFEIRVLYWAAKKGALSRDLAIQIMTLASTKREFDPILYRLLCLTYDRYPKDEMVMTVCSYLIRNQKYSHQFFYWYERGIELNLRITGLNEAYLYSMDMTKEEELPKIIQMYFRYSSALPYQKKAELFAKIIKNRDSQQEIYQNYRKEIELFTMHQIEEGHIDDNLAVVYEDMLKQGLINRELSVRLAKILFTHKLICTHKDAVCAYVIHPEVREVQCVPFTDGVAYIRLYTSQYCVFVEDREGRRYIPNEAGYQIKRLFNPGIFLRKCMEYAPDEISYLIYHFDGKSNFHTYLEGDKYYLHAIMDSDLVTDTYKAGICPEVIRFYDEYADEEKVDNYLKRVDFALVTKADRAYLTELLIEKRMFEEAYAMIERYGFEQFDPAKLVPLCSFQIENYEGEEDDFLLALCEMAFRNRKYNGTLLDYLCRYYGGTVAFMCEIWKAAKEFDTDTFELEERLICQMLYTEAFTESIWEIYESYVNHGGKLLVRMAYLNFFAYRYFVKDAEISPAVFREIRAWHDEEDEEDLPDVCRLALLKYYSSEKELAELEEPVVDELLGYYAEQEMYFPFYKKYTNRIVEKYQLIDKIFLQYITEPERHVVLHYTYGDEEGTFITEDMTNMYGGIFVRQFILFFGDSIQYYITEEDENRSEVVQTGKISNNDVYGEYHESRYGLLNEIFLNMTLKEQQTFEDKIREYAVMSEIAENKFRLL